MTRVLLDVDGVIADFIGGFRVRAERILDPGVASSLDPLPGAIDGVGELAKVADVYFVASPVYSSPTWSHDRGLWLVDHFGKELGGKVVHTRHKHLCSGDILVDDKPGNVEAWKAAHPNGLGLLWDAPYNWGSDVELRRCFGWAELVALAEQGRKP